MQNTCICPFDVLFILGELKMRAVDNILRSIPIIFRKAQKYRECNKLKFASKNDVTQFNPLKKNILISKYILIYYKHFFANLVHYCDIF